MSISYEWMGWRCIAVLPAVPGHWLLGSGGELVRGGLEKIIEC